MAETGLHWRAILDVATPLLSRYADRSDVYVGGDTMMYYIEGNNEISISPDVFVAFGPSREPVRRVWKTWEEGKLADFVLEVASKKTHGRDEREKRALYQSLGVAEYWQFDATGEYLSPVLQGRRLNAAGAYELLPLATTPEGGLRGKCSAFTSTQTAAACVCSTRPRGDSSSSTWNMSALRQRRTTPSPRNAVPAKQPRPNSPN